MRGEMARHKPAKGPLDIKLARGGLVDVEFITHYLQLREGQGLDGAGVRALLKRHGIELWPGVGRHARLRAREVRGRYVRGWPQTR